MTKPIRPRDLRAGEIDIVRMVARGWSNAHIAGELGIPTDTLKSRIAVIYKAVGIGAPEGMFKSDAGVARTQLVIWAFEHGHAEKTPRLPAAQSGPLLALCVDILADRPRGDLKRHARAALVAAGVVRLPVVLGRPENAAGRDEQAAA